MLTHEFYYVRREIIRHGASYDVVRPVLDEYKEFTGEQEKVCSICGLFHITKGHVTESVQDSTTAHRKGSPCLLCLYEDQIDIKDGDYVLINGKRFKVVDKNNIQEFNIVSDLSLEVVIDGDEY